MTFLEKVENYLNLDRINTAGELVRARAVYVIGLIFVATQLVNMFSLTYSYRGFTFDHVISITVSILVITSIYNLRYKLNFPFYAILFSFLIIIGTLASAVPDQTGINSALIPFFVLGCMANGFICGTRAVAIFCGFGLVTIWYLYSVSMGVPAGELLDAAKFGERNFQRAFQASLALIMVGVVCGLFSHNLHEAFTNLESSLAKAEESDRAKTQFLANMSHELRTPMNGILGVSEVLLETDLDVEQTELAALINQSGETLLTLISDVLLFSQIESNTVRLSEEKFNMVDCINNAALPHRVLAAQKKLKIYMSIPPNLPQSFIGDEKRIRHALSSLIGNAVKFTNEGRIDISVIATPTLSGVQRVVLSVKDTGIGISEEKLPIIFERFRQIDETRKRLYGGTGLGLTVAQGLLNLMGGNISAMSREGDGSIFAITVDLPLADTAQNPQQMPRAAVPETGLETRSETRAAPTPAFRPPHPSLSS